MKILVCSDLHLDHHKDGGLGLLEELGAVPHDVCVIAGDMCGWEHVPRALRIVSRVFKQTLYVIGNHECYGTTIRAAVEHARWSRGMLSDPELENVVVLENDEYSIDGVRFLGCTLWFRYPSPVASRFKAESGMNDFSQIENFRKTVGQKNQQSVFFLDHMMRPGDVVITHHLPSFELIDPVYRASPLNDFFACELHELILEKQPGLWIHGHSHTALDRMLFKTRVVRNPFGYPQENSGFQHKVIEYP